MGEQLLSNNEILEILRGKSDEFLIECTKDLYDGITPEMLHFEMKTMEKETTLHQLERECYYGDLFPFHLGGLSYLITIELGRRLNENRTGMDFLVTH